jgi:hypothetical protein
MLYVPPTVFFHRHNYIVTFLKNTSNKVKILNAEKFGMDVFYYED